MGGYRHITRGRATQRRRGYVLYPFIHDGLTTCDFSLAFGHISETGIWRSGFGDLEHHLPMTISYIVMDLRQGLTTWSTAIRYRF